jgi:hypothetical protein
MLAPPPLDDARRSLAYWQQRQQTLRFYQRSARQEAREMAARWDARVRAAEHARFAATVPGRILAALGLSGLFVQRSRFSKGRLALLLWAFVPPPVKAIAAGVAAAWLIVFVASATLAGALLAYLA